MIDIHNLKNKVLGGYKVTYDEGVELTKHPNKEELYKAADEIRQAFCGNKMDLCSITNAKSGKCPQNCKWCSQSKFAKSNIEEYEIVDKEEAMKQVMESEANGVHRHSLVTSGRRVSEKTLTGLLDIYQTIKENSDISLCASMGLVDESQMERLKEIGIEHYHCNLETAPSFFPEVCTTHTIDEKINTIKMAQKMGIKVCSGGIIGMGESMEQRVELAFTLSELDVQSIPINILTPVEGTALENAVPLSEEEVLTSIAVFRFLNPKANLRFAGGRMQIRHFQHKALRAGISAALTGNYLTTTGSDIHTDIKDFEAAGFKIDVKAYASK
ncbi:MAG: biotin synthase BioB [Bacteroidales bacterium]|nr:biotin synthase BioB [Bacteroidales bacterium]